MAPTKSKSTGTTKKKPVKKTPAAKKTSAKTKKKTGTKTPARKKPAGKKTPGFVHEVKKTVLGVVILIAVCLTTAMLIDIFLRAGQPVPSTPLADKKEAPTAQSPAPAPPPASRETPVPPGIKEQPAVEPKILTRAEGLKKKAHVPGTSSTPRTPAPQSRAGSAIVYEVYDDHVTPAPPKKAVLTPKSHAVPLVAIIIDDIGYDKDLAMGLLNVDKNITFSILPFSPAGTQLARKLSAKGAELMLHLPMEPTQYPKVNPGPGALLSSMSPDELLAQLDKDIQAVPGTVGANNHMGSRLTADEDKMNQIFTVLKKNNLFFIDSRTSVHSKGEQSARMFQLKFSQRDVFLDNFQDVEYISGQIEKLIKQARTHGSAIGIGHPHKATLAALKRELPKLKGKVKIVPASRLVEVPQS